MIFALPRSRTAWLSWFLSRGFWRVGHDLAVEADTFSGFLSSFASGTVETGAVSAHQLIRQAIPTARFFTIRRPIAQVIASLARLGIEGQETDLAARDSLLDEAEAAGATRIDYPDLDRFGCCADLYQAATGAPLDFRWWQTCAPRNVQIDMPARLQRLAARQTEINHLKTEVAGTLARIASGENVDLLRIAWESDVRAFLAEAEPLAVSHTAEVYGGPRYGAPLALDHDLMERMSDAGAFYCLGARLNGRLVGYMTWSIGPDPESKGVILGQQGGWYVGQDDDLRRHRIGQKLMAKSRADLRAAGVHCLDLHHQLCGRGADLGRWFAHMGAIEYQRRYALWIGD